jgi:transposase
MMFKAAVLNELQPGVNTALRDQVSRAYYTRKISQGKRHNQALIALARRRCDVLFAMLRDGTLYSNL